MADLSSEIATLAKHLERVLPLLAEVQHYKALHSLVEKLLRALDDDFDLRRVHNLRVPKLRTQHAWKTSIAYQQRIRANADE